MGVFTKQLDRERRIDEIMRGSFREWQVDKQVIAVHPNEQGSKELVVRGSEVQFVDYTWPRIIRITITNGMQSHLIGDTGIGVEHEVHFNQLVSQAEDRVLFLNENKVR